MAVEAKNVRGYKFLSMDDVNDALIALAAVITLPGGDGDVTTTLLGVNNGLDEDGATVLFYYCSSNEQYVAALGASTVFAVNTFY